MPQEQSSNPIVVKVKVPHGLGLTQKQLDELQERFRVEIIGNIGAVANQQIVVQAVNAPDNDY